MSKPLDGSAVVESERLTDPAVRNTFGTGVMTSAAIISSRSGPTTPEAIGVWNPTAASVAMDAIAAFFLQDMGRAWHYRRTQARTLNHVKPTDHEATT